MRSKVILLSLPFLLLATMVFVFRAGAANLGKEAGYLLGFAVYWLFWCLGIPLALLGRFGFVGLWQERTPLFSRRNWLAALLFIVITAVTIWMYGGNFIRAQWILILLAIPAATVNGICEELLWRGLYVRTFSSNPWMGILYPALGFAAWHIAPEQVFPASEGMFPFVLSTFFLGLAYGFIAYRTGSARWTAFSHSLNGILALSGMLAPSLLTINSI
jgi:membrane protease YdiL (CAAX protease family)